MRITERQSLWEKPPESEKEENTLASLLLLPVFLIYFFIFHCPNFFLAWSSESRNGVGRNQLPSKQSKRMARNEWI